MAVAPCSVIIAHKVWKFWHTLSHFKKGIISQMACNVNHSDNVSKNIFIPFVIIWIRKIQRNIVRFRYIKTMVFIHSAQLETHSVNFQTIFHPLTKNIFYYRNRIMNGTELLPCSSSEQSSTPRLRFPQCPSSLTHMNMKICR